MSVSLSRRARVIGGAAAAVVVVAVALVVVLNSRGGSAVRISAPSYVADPVPSPKPLSSDDLPKGCGVRKATRDKYVPGGGDIGDPSGPGPDCEWYKLNSDCHGVCSGGGPYSQRALSVTIGPERRGIAETSADGDALRDLDPADAYRVAAGGAERPVDGIGDEALYHYSPADDGVDVAYGDSGASLKFRTGATVVTVDFRADDNSRSRPDRQFAEKDERPAVFAAATDIAKALRVRSAPVFAATKAAKVPPPAPRTVRPCELVPAALAHRLAAGAVRGRAQGALQDVTPKRPQPYGLAGDSCAWDAEKRGKRPERHLIVTVWSESEWRPGIAVAQATRLYLERHDDARAAAPAGFQAVRGLGDQAYATYQKIEGGTVDSAGQVIFRYRNLVADVDYYGGAHPLDRKTAVNGAYTAATAVLRGLR